MSEILTLALFAIALLAIGTVALVAVLLHDIRTRWSHLEEDE